MNMTEYDGEREVLREQVERDERELRRAFDDLMEAWNRPFRAIERFALHRAPWIFSAVLVGVWFGSRGNHNHEEA